MKTSKSVAACIGVCNLWSCAYITDQYPVQKLSDEERSRLPAIERAVELHNEADLEAIAQATARNRRAKLETFLLAGAAFVGLAKGVGALNKAYRDAYENDSVALEPAVACPRDSTQGYRVTGKRKPFSASNVEYGDGSTVRCYDADHPNGAESKDIHLRVKDLKWVKPSGLGDMYVSDSFDKAAERACCPLL
jgi:hypothetical protein